MTGCLMRYMTAGESHGQRLTAIVEGVPAGLRVSAHQINVDLKRRQGGYGRGGRQDIEHDVVSISAGVRFGRTIGAPVALSIENRDWCSWQERMAVEGEAPSGMPRTVAPRPGHADLVGALKTDTDDCTDVAERASARETAARVAVAGVAREFLADCGVDIYSYVVSIGTARLAEDDPMAAAASYKPLDIELSEVRCPDEAATAAMKRRIDEARSLHDSLGGTFRVVAAGLLPGIGGYATAGERLTGRLGAALFSIPAVKGVEFGLGFAAAALPGSACHDVIEVDAGRGFTRASNRAGGLEGGMTTGLPLIATCAMKPIPTMGEPLGTVNLDTLEPARAASPRADVCAVPACAVVAEAEVALVLADAYLEKFGHDNMSDIRSAIECYKRRLRTMAR